MDGTSAYECQEDTVYLPVAHLSLKEFLQSRWWDEAFLKVELFLDHDLWRLLKIHGRIWIAVFRRRPWYTC